MKKYKYALMTFLGDKNTFIYCLLRIKNPRKLKKYNSLISVTILDVLINETKRNSCELIFKKDSAKQIYCYSKYFYDVKRNGQPKGIYNSKISKNMLFEFQNDEAALLWFKVNH